MLLAGRVRKPEEVLIIQNILEKHFKRTVNPDVLFSEAQVTSQFSEFGSTNTAAIAHNTFRDQINDFQLGMLSSLVVPLHCSVNKHQ